MNYQNIVKEIVSAVGGKENIVQATHCVTRLRLTLKEPTYDLEKLENVEGAKGVFFNKGQLQIVFGTGVVERVHEAFTNETETDNSQAEVVQDKEKNWKDKLTAFLTAF